MQDVLSAIRGTNNERELNRSEAINGTDRSMRAAALRSLRRGEPWQNARAAAIAAASEAAHWYDRERSAQRAFEWAEKRILLRLVRV